MITWENPPTTVFVEMKFLSGLSAKVSNDDGTSGFPSDQLIRNIRVGLLRCGYFQTGDTLFAQEARDLIVLVVAPTKDHPLVKRYRDPELLRMAIPHSERLIGHPRSPFIGELSFADLVSLLRRQSRRFSRPERQVIDDLTEYLEFKVMSNPVRPSSRTITASTGETTVSSPTPSTGPTLLTTPSI